jgi:hypothetical protein
MGRSQAAGHLQDKRLEAADASVAHARNVLLQGLSQRKAEGSSVPAPCEPRTGVTVAPSSYSPPWLAVRLVISILGAFAASRVCP